MATEKKISVEGFIAALVFHVLILLLMLFYGLPYITPPPPEMGIAVNLGMDDAGAGLVEPMTAEETAAANNPSAVAPSEENTLTQDVEETPVVAEKKTIKPKETVKPKDQKKEEKNPVEEKNIEPKKEVNKKALMGPNNKTGNTVGEGVTSGNGNQGVSNGTQGALNYGQGGGNSVSFSLNGRAKRFLPEPIKTKAEAGIVVVKITVDRNGNVTNAFSGAKGTNIDDENILKEARQAALKSKFSSKAEAAVEESGTITYVYTVK